MEKYEEQQLLPKIVFGNNPVLSREQKTYHKEQMQADSSILQYRPLEDIVHNLDLTNTQAFLKTIGKRQHKIQQQKGAHVLLSPSEIFVHSPIDATFSKDTCSRDEMNSLANIYCFVLTDGKHSEYSEKLTEKDIVHPDACEALDLIKRMVLNEKVPSMEDIHQHPFHWNEQQKLFFLCKTYEHLSSRRSTHITMHDLNKSATYIVSEDWIEMLKLTNNDMKRILTKQNQPRNRISENVIYDLCRGYDRSSVYELLRFIRNRYVHCHEDSEVVQQAFGSRPVEFWRFFSSRFPRLFMHIYDNMERNLLQDEEIERCLATDYQHIGSDSGYQADKSGSSLEKAKKYQFSLPSVIEEKHRGKLNLLLMFEFMMSISILPYDEKEEERENDPPSSELMKFQEIFRQALSQNKEEQFCNCGVIDKDEELLKSLTKTKYKIEKSNLLNIKYNCDIDAEQYDVLGRLISAHRMSLRAPCNITDEEIASFFCGFGNGMLKELDISCSNFLTTKGFWTVAQFAATNGIKALKLGGCRLTRKHVDILYKPLLDGKASNKLIELDMSYNNTLKPEDYDIIGQIVERCKVKKLRFAGCELTKDHLKNLTIGTQYNEVDIIDVDDNISIGNGIAELAKSVKRLKLKKIIISDCMLTKQHLEGFRDALNGATICRLDLSDTGRSPGEIYIMEICKLLPYITDILFLRCRSLNASCRRLLQRQINEIPNGTTKISLVDGCIIRQVPNTETKHGDETRI